MRGVPGDDHEPAGPDDRQPVVVESPVWNLGKAWVDDIVLFFRGGGSQLSTGGSSSWPGPRKRMLKTAVAWKTRL